MSLVLLAAACASPTERSGDLRVALGPVSALYVADTGRITARVIDAAGAEVLNARVLFHSSDAAVLSVDSASGRVYAVRAGIATVTARAVGFQDAAPASQPVRVYGLIEVDSVRPTAALYGQVVRVFGRGLDRDSLFSVTVGGYTAPIGGYVPLDSARPNREGVLSLFVPPVATGSAPLIVAGTQGSTSGGSVTVTPHDLYEPNDTVPYDLGVLSSAPFHNPALYLEPGVGADPPYDFYKFTNPTVHDRSIRIHSPKGGLFVEVVSAPFSLSGLLFYCNPDLGRMALKNLPAGDYILAVGALSTRTGAARGYDLEIDPSYVSELPPDSHEEDDFCSLAKSVAVPFGPLDLTLDSERDQDWFPFTIPPGGQVVGFSMQAADPAAAVELDLTDTLFTTGFSLLADSNGTISVVDTLPAGSYVLRVWSTGLKATPYVLSASLPFGPAPPAQFPIRSTVHRGAPRPMPVWRHPR